MKKKKSGYVKAAEISQAVNTAFQENMSSFRQDIESEISSIRQEIGKLDDVETLQDVADSVRKLVTAGKENLACFDKISQLAKNSSENVTTVANISACQSKQNVKIDTNNSSLLKLKHQLEAVHSQNNHHSSAQAKGMEKVESLGTNQAKILELLSSLKENSDIIQDRLNAVEQMSGATGTYDTSSLISKNSGEAVSYTHLRAHET